MKRVFFELVQSDGLVVVALYLCSCNVSDFSRLATQVKIESISGVELKGMTGIELTLDIRNGAPDDITMNNAVLDLNYEGDKVATLTQVGGVLVEGGSRGAVRTMWRLEGASPVTLLMLAAQISQSDYSGLTIDFTADIEFGRLNRSFTGRGVKLSKIVGVIAN